jgi:hypothetical protein
MGLRIGHRGAVRGWRWVLLSFAGYQIYYACIHRGAFASETSFSLGLVQAGPIIATVLPLPVVVLDPELSVAAKVAAFAGTGTMARAARWQHLPAVLCVPLKSYTIIPLAQGQRLFTW